MKKSNILLGGTVLTLGVMMILGSCRTIPKGVTAVQPFDSQRYLGKWYEIARLDFRFEKNMSHVTAEYSLKDSKTIRVVNRGFDEKKQEWEQSTGKAKFVDGPNTGKLKVSFFGPFYSGYNVIAIDEDYRYALVIGKNEKYMWLLSREKTMPEEVRNRYLRIAEQIGYDTSNLVWTVQQ